ncbi:MAG: MBL fold metallo-hydrolase [Acidobacteria bacterium]|nr:MBL fold metallo-hydrolase [Acidobacteriota bacterium]
MCRVSRREMLLGGAALLGAAATESKAKPITNAKTAPATPLAVEVGKVDQVSDGVYFHQGNILVGHCNNGWIIFEDYVLVIDGNYPSGAREIIPKIRALTDKPIRFAFDTHHHGDHAYGNQVWVENGAVPVAHTGVIDEMKKYETGYYGGAPGRWEDEAKRREDVRGSKLKPPSVLFPREMIFDDGKHRVELRYLGVGHTHGDAYAWLPKEKILFTGDACVNGSFNFVGDGNIEKWIATIEEAKKLGAKIICPGHGPRGAETVLNDQQKYFRSLRGEVSKLIKAKKTPEQIRDSTQQVQTSLKADASIARYAERSTLAHIEKVYEEMTGKKLPAAQKASREAHDLHAVAHGHRSDLVMQQQHHHGHT